MVCLFTKQKEVNRFTLVNGRLYVETYWNPLKITGDPRNLSLATLAARFLHWHFRAPGWD